jgi:hypothetical protein
MEEFHFTDLYYLQRGQKLSMENLPAGPFFSKRNRTDLIQIPYGYRLVRCDNTGDYDEPEWRNPISGKIHREHPLGENFGDIDYYEYLYEITPFEGPPLEEGDVWDHETNTTVRVEKPERTSVWNSFRQRWEPECNKTCLCFKSRIKYDSVKEKFYDCFPSEELHFFFKVYCDCCVCECCGSVHTYSCREECGV